MAGSPAHPVPAGPPPATVTGGITGLTTHEPVSFPENPFHPSSIPTSADKGCSTCVKLFSHLILRGVQVYLLVSSLSPSIQQQGKPEPLSPCAQPTDPKLYTAASKLALPQTTVFVLQPLVHQARERGMISSFLETRRDLRRAHLIQDPESGQVREHTPVPTDGADGAQKGK